MWYSLFSPRACACEEYPSFVCTSTELPAVDKRLVPVLDVIGCLSASESLPFAATNGIEPDINACGITNRKFVLG